MKRIISVLLVAVLALGMLTACGSSGTGAATGNNTATSAVSNEDRVLHMYTTSTLTSTDWQTTTLMDDMRILWVQVYEGLYGMDESKGGYINLLAKDIAVSDDGLTYTVTLVDAQFQNGDPLTAEDVVFSYENAMQNPRFNYVTSFINKVEAQDDKTVVFTLDYPYSAISHTFWTVKIYSKREYEEVTASGKAFGVEPNTAATGPYILTAYDANTVTLEANENYWGGAPEIKHVQYQVISESAAQVIAYENNELDYFYNVPNSDWENVSKTAGDNCEMVTANDVYVMFINYLSPTNNNILGNEKVREAIMYCINKADCINGGLGGYGTPAYEYMYHEYVATSPNYEDGNFKVFDYDLEKARQCLLDAGLTEEELAKGVDVGSIITYGTPTSTLGKMCVVAQANLAAIGLNATVEVQDYSVIGPRMYDQDYDIAFFSDSGNFDFNNIRQQVHSESVGMYLVRYKDPASPFDWEKIESLVDAGVATADVAERYDVYTELWAMIADTATILPIAHAGCGIAWSRNITFDGLCPTYYHIDSFHWAN